MREKSRERRKGAGFGLGKGGFPGFRTRVKDRFLRALKIRGREIDISSTNYLADAEFRISVTFSGSVHFIFMDMVLLKWLGMILQAALEDGWRFGKCLLKRSGSRTLHVGCFTLKDARFLRLMEICGNGKRFFVSIPMDEDKVGWGSWLKTVQSVVEERKERKVSKVGQSYAEVTGGVIGCSVANRSVPLVEGTSIPCIEVPEGSGFDVKEQRLKRWVVFNFLLGPKDFVSWEDFRRWMWRWWGVGVDREVKLLGDDSWLAECKDESEASKIVKRGSWHFRGVQVEVRLWFPAAGRLNHLETQGLRWVLVFGIPVHFRSEEVFRKIGDSCRGFVDSQDTNFAAVRLKVKSGEALPSSLYLAVKGMRFEIKILEEPGFSCPMDVGKRRWESSMAAGTTPEFEAAELLQFGEAARVGWGCGEEGDGLFTKPISKERNSGGCHKTLNGLWEFGDFGGTSVGSVLGCSFFQEEELLKEMGAKSFGEADVGHEWALSKAFLESSLQNDFQVRGDGGSDLSGPFLIIGEAGGANNEERQRVALVPSYLMDETGGIREEEDVSDGTSAKDLVMSEVDRMLVLGLGAEIGDEEFSVSTSGNNDLETIEAMGQSLAKLFDLSLEGSKEAALEEVERVTKEVLHRRALSVPKSKQDLELRRINWRMVEMSQVGSARRSRYVSSDFVSDYS
ncbi:hypothetical protein LINPERPRIM_LOCUS33790 [Linum perenne]